MAFAPLFFQSIMSRECFSVGYLMKGNHHYMRWGRDVMQQWSVLDLYDAQLRRVSLACRPPRMFSLLRPFSETRMMDA